ncbi:uncharacterized protein [Aegilops tauschii subsp. strangulata]|uniref:uncharacterized protein isoform X1 n=1 Tax=Aegilops tauschii subsp. strangulata TaxID=200361 RepID=UPI00098B0948|nr:uncharacterized protein LOC109758368 isoform X1 [Aegilops tauschii subsp. strangulata]
MATCTRAPPATAAATAAVTTDPGKERGAFLPELEKGKDAAILPPAIAPAVLAKPGKESGAFLPELEKGKDDVLPAAVAPAFLAKTAGKEMDSCLPPPEKEKPLARPAPNTAAENLVNPGKKMRRPVPMTDEERNKIKELKEQHRSGLDELEDLFQILKELRDYRDELLFRRRCLAARLVSRIVFQRGDAAYIKRHLDMGLKMGDKLPEELKQARPPISMALFLWHEMGRALHIGMDNFLDEYSNTEECQRSMLALVPGAVCDENGAPRDSVASQE